MGWFNKKNKDKMLSVEELSTKQQELSQWSYQWKKGENLGNISEFADLTEKKGKYFILFDDGKKLALNLLNEYCDRFQGEVPPIDPLGVKPESAVTSTNTQVNNVNIGKPVNDSPIIALLKTQKENLVDVGINIKINLPSEDLYKTLCNSFEGAPDEILDFVVSSISVESIKEAVKQAVENYYGKDNTKD